MLRLSPGVERLLQYALQVRWILLSLLQQTIRRRPNQRITVSVAQDLADRSWAVFEILGTSAAHSTAHSTAPIPAASNVGMRANGKRASELGLAVVRRYCA